MLQCPHGCFSLLGSLLLFTFALRLLYPVARYGGYLNIYLYKININAKKVKYYSKKFLRHVSFLAMNNYKLCWVLE